MTESTLFDSVENFDIVPTHLAVQAMRDNGYRNAAYALAELMDNAIQANASVVELLCAEKTVQILQRQRQRIDQLAVLDNGSGMDAEVLRMAMQFGNGTHLTDDKQNGIGKFGMGLPASSISQCTRVEVWTWQNGPESAIYTFLDLDQIKRRKQNSVPRPEAKPIPELWREVGSEFGNSGTLVVWTNLDKCLWRTASAIIDNSQFVIGRMYRKFIDRGDVVIRFTNFNVATPNQRKTELALPTDPGYLIERTSCPPPFDDKAMFKPWGDENYEVVFKVDFNGAVHPVTLRFSYAKEEARQGDNPGNRPYGKHAFRNVGISIVRADRELEMDQTLVIPYDPVERWWGIELDFPPALDELLGVTNNKQSARNLVDVLRMDFDAILKGTTINQLKAELAAEDDPRGPLVEVANKIRTSLRSLRDALKAQRQGSRTPQRYETSVAEATATARTKDRQEEGKRGTSDRDEQLPATEREEIIATTLVDEGLSESVAKELAARTVGNNLKYTFVESSIETDAFFSVKQRGGANIIVLNTRHPAYQCLVEVLEEDTQKSDEEALRRRLENALDGLKLLLFAWARYEDELEGVPLQRAQDIRSDWGRIARDFLQPEVG